jgi:protein involved in polysaccharide export with SLBB domain
MRSTLLLTLLAAALLARAAVPATPASTVAPSAPAENIINVGDRLRYQVLEDEDPPTEIVVSNTGRIELPYYGPIEAAGKSLPQLVSDITLALQKDLYVKATVRLNVIEFHTRAVNRGRVHLSGQVRKIGPVDIDMSELNTLGKIILAAGGVTDFAETRAVRIIRKSADGGFTTISVDLRAVLEKGQIEKDVELRDGDFIIVDERLIKW